jgi:structure-specific recognition protein 1
MKSPYMQFSMTKHDKVKQENPSVNFGDIGKILGERWKNLSITDKQVFLLYFIFFIVFLFDT